MKSKIRCQDIAFVVALGTMVVGCAVAGSSETDEPIATTGESLVKGPSKSELKARAFAEAPAVEPAQLVAPSLANRLDGVAPDELVDVDIFLVDDGDDVSTPNESASGDLTDIGSTSSKLNGLQAGEEDLRNHLKAMSTRAQQREARQRARNTGRWNSVSSRFGLGGREVELAKRSGASSVSLRLSARAIRNIAASGGAGLVQSIVPRYAAVGADGLTSALQSVEISTSAFPSGWNGTDVGVWMNDGDGRPNTTFACVNTNRLTVQDYGSEPLETHATQTLCTLQASANDAVVHYAVPTQSCNLRSDVASFANPPVYLSSQSNSFGDDDTTYSDCSRDWDNFVYNTNIAHFALTQNQNSNVRGAAKAYNVISVGAYDDAPNPDTIATFTNFGDPETGADKPEIVAPGVSLDVGTWTGISGTSFSTPIAAGFGADVLEYRTAFRYQPALLKAYLMVNAVRVDGTSLFGDKDGAGRLDFSNALYGKWFWWNGGNGSWFSTDSDGDGRLEIDATDTLTSGNTYHVALSWLVSGTYVRSNKKPNMDLDLRVVAPNGSAWSSVSVVNNYEMVSFVAPVSGTYHFYVERFWNSGQGDVRVGLVVRRR